MKCRDCLVWKNKRKDLQLTIDNYSYLAPLSGKILEEYKRNLLRPKEHDRIADHTCERECILLPTGLRDEIDNVVKTGTLF